MSGAAAHRQRTDQARPPVELVNGALHVLGDTVPLDARISWYPPVAGGHVPFNAYVFADAPDLLVEAAVPAVFPALLAQLRMLEMEGACPTRVAVTRNEPDSVASVPLLVREAGLRAVHSPGLLNTLQFFAMDEAGARERSFSHQAETFQMMDFGVDCLPARADATVPVAEGHMLTVIAAPLKILPTVWYHDAQTRTLFCSDSFAEEVAAEPGQRVLHTVDDEPTLVARFLDSFTRKFDWLERSSLSSTIADLETIFERYPCDRLAPSRGLIVEGRDAVATKQRALLRALRWLER